MENHLFWGQKVKVTRHKNRQHRFLHSCEGVSSTSIMTPYYRIAHDRTAPTRLRPRRVWVLAFLGRLLWVDVIKWVYNIRPSVRPSTKSFFDFNEIWCVCRGRWVMHDGMQYELIQGQGHEPLKVGNLAIFERLSPPPNIMGAGKWPRILKLGRNT